MHENQVSIDESATNMSIDQSIGISSLPSTQFSFKIFNPATYSSVNSLKEITYHIPTPKKNKDKDKDKDKDTLPKYNTVLDGVVKNTKQNHSIKLNQTSNTKSLLRSYSELQFTTYHKKKINILYKKILKKKSFLELSPTGKLDYLHQLKFRGIIYGKIYNTSTSSILTKHKITKNTLLDTFVKPKTSEETHKCRLSTQYKNTNPDKSSFLLNPNNVTIKSLKHLSKSPLFYKSQYINTQSECIPSPYHLQDHSTSIPNSDLRSNIIPNQYYSNHTNFSSIPNSSIENKESLSFFRSFNQMSLCMYLILSDFVLHAILSQVTPTKREKQLKSYLFNSLLYFLKSRNHNFMKLHLTGSTAYQIDIKGSDLDLVVMTPETNCLTVLQNIADLIKRFQIESSERDLPSNDYLRYSKTQVIDNARVPILLLKYIPGTDCDISVNTINSINHTDFFYNILKNKFHLRALMRIIKYWVKARKLPIMRDGGLPSIVWMLLCLLVYRQSEICFSQSVIDQIHENDNANQYESTATVDSPLFNRTLYLDSAKRMSSNFTHWIWSLEPNVVDINSFFPYTILLGEFFSKFRNRSNLSVTVSIAAGLCIPKNSSDLANKILSPLLHFGTWDDLLSIEDPSKFDHLFFPEAFFVSPEKILKRPIIAPHVESNGLPTPLFSDLATKVSSATWLVYQYELKRAALIMDFVTSRFTTFKEKTLQHGLKISNFLKIFLNVFTNTFLYLFSDNSKERYRIPAILEKFQDIVKPSNIFLKMHHHVSPEMNQLWNPFNTNVNNKLTKNSISFPSIMKNFSIPQDLTQCQVKSLNSFQPINHDNSLIQKFNPLMLDYTIGNIHADSLKCSSPVLNDRHHHLNVYTVGQSKDSVLEHSNESQIQGLPFSKCHLGSESKEFYKSFSLLSDSSLNNTNSSPSQKSDESTVSSYYSIRSIFPESNDKSDISRVSKGFQDNFNIEDGQNTLFLHGTSNLLSDHQESSCDMMEKNIYSPSNVHPHFTTFDHLSDNDKSLSLKNQCSSINSLKYDIKKSHSTNMKSCSYFDNEKMDYIDPSNDTIQSGFCFNPIRNIKSDRLKYFNSYDSMNIPSSSLFGNSNINQDRILENQCIQWKTNLTKTTNCVQPSQLYKSYSMVLSTCNEKISSKNLLNMTSNPYETTPHRIQELYLKKNLSGDNIKLYNASMIMNASPNLKKSEPKALDKLEASAHKKFEFFLVLLGGKLILLKLSKICMNRDGWWSNEFLSRRDIRSVLHGIPYFSIILPKSELFKELDKHIYVSVSKDNHQSIFQNNNSSSNLSNSVILTDLVQSNHLANPTQHDPVESCKFILNDHKTKYTLGTPNEYNHQNAHVTHHTSDAPKNKNNQSASNKEESSESLGDFKSNILEGFLKLLENTSPYARWFVCEFSKFNDIMSNISICHPSFIDSDKVENNCMGTEQNYKYFFNCNVSTKSHKTHSNTEDDRHFDTIMDSIKKYNQSLIKSTYTSNEILFNPCNVVCSFQAVSLNIENTLFELSSSEFNCLFDYTQIAKEAPYWYSNFMDLQKVQSHLEENDLNTKFIHETVDSCSLTGIQSSVLICKHCKASGMINLHSDIGLPHFPLNIQSMLELFLSWRIHLKKSSFISSFKSFLFNLLRLNDDIDQNLKFPEEKKELSLLKDTEKIARSKLKKIESYISKWFESQMECMNNPHDNTLNSKSKKNISAMYNNLLEIMKNDKDDSDYDIYTNTDKDTNQLLMTSPYGLNSYPISYYNLHTSAYHSSKQRNTTEVNTYMYDITESRHILNQYGSKDYPQYVGVPSPKCPSPPINYGNVGVSKSTHTNGYSTDSIYQYSRYMIPSTKKSFQSPFSTNMSPKLYLNEECHDRKSYFASNEYVLPDNPNTVYLNNTSTPIMHYPIYDHTVNSGIHLPVISDDPVDGYTNIYSQQTRMPTLTNNNYNVNGVNRRKSLDYYTKCNYPAENFNLLCVNTPLLNKSSSDNHKIIDKYPAPMMYPGKVNYLLPVLNDRNSIQSRNSVYSYSPTIHYDSEKPVAYNKSEHKVKSPKSQSNISTIIQQKSVPTGYVEMNNKIYKTPQNLVLGIPPEKQIFNKNNLPNINTPLNSRNIKSKEGISDKSFPKQSLGNSEYIANHKHTSAGDRYIYNNLYTNQVPSTLSYRSSYSHMHNEYQPLRGYVHPSKNHDYIDPNCIPPINPILDKLKYIPTLMSYPAYYPVTQLYDVNMPYKQTVNPMDHIIPKPYIKNVDYPLYDKSKVFSYSPTVYPKYHETFQMNPIQNNLNTNSVSFVSSAYVSPHHTSSPYKVDFPLPLDQNTLYYKNANTYYLNRVQDITPFNRKDYPSPLFISHNNTNYTNISQPIEVFNSNENHNAFLVNPNYPKKYPSEKNSFYFLPPKFSPNYYPPKTYNNLNSLNFTTQKKKKDYYKA